MSVLKWSAYLRAFGIRITPTPAGHIVAYNMGEKIEIAPDDFLAHPEVYGSVCVVARQAGIPIAVCRVGEAGYALRKLHQIPPVSMGSRMIAQVYADQWTQGRVPPRVGYPRSQALLR